MLIRDVAQYEDFLAFLRSKSLSQSEWVYPFVRTSEERRAYRDKAEHMVLGTKNLGTSGLVVNREILMYKVEVKVGSEMQVQEKEIPTQQMVSQELASLHVGFSASAKHITRVRSQVDRLKAAGFFFPRSMGGLRPLLRGNCICV